MPESATVVKKNGKRYVKVGKRRIKVAPDISERELIQWMIKHFKPKRRTKKPKIQDVFTAVQPKVTVFQSGTVAVNDANRATLREAKDKLEEMQKKLTTIEEEKKALPPAPPALPAAARPALNPPSAPPTPPRTPRRIQLFPPASPPIPPRTVLARSASESASASSSSAEKPIYTRSQARAVLDKQKEINAMEKDLAAQKLTLESKVSADVQSTIAAYTVAKLQQLAGMTEATYKREGYVRDTLLAELIKNGTINKEAMKQEFAAKKYSEDDKAIAVLEQRIAEEQIKLKNMVGSGNIPDEGLSELDINKAMKGHRQFLGTIAADEISLLKPGNEKRVCWIMNTDPRGKGGTHWVAFFIDARPSGTHSVEYYDPLADPISAAFLANVKQVVKAVHGSDSYLKFRENKIADQSDASNNCGPFCIRFLQARLAGESFAKATGWDKAGEKNIEIWKKHPKQQLWISGQTGEGLRDIFAAIKKGATKIYDRIKATLSGPRGGAPPAVRGWLAKYGDTEIQQVWVCKKPIYSIIESIANWLSQGKMRENMDRLGYDRMMHLYMIVQLKNGPTVKIEKNHVVEIKNSGDLGQRHMSTGHPATVAAMIKQAEAGHGEAVWKYHLVDANCQKFIMWCLGTHASAGVRDFVQQDVEESLKDMGLFKKIATVVTDVAGAADVAMNGAGK